MNKQLGRVAIVAVGAIAAAVLTSGVATAAPAATCNGKTVTIFIQPGETSVFGTDGDDVIQGSQGAEDIYGAGGNDTVCALGGDDFISGDDGYDTVFAGAGDDRIWLVDRTDDYADGGSGHDVATVDWDPQDTTVNVEERY